MNPLSSSTNRSINHENSLFLGATLSDALLLVFAAAPASSAPPPPPPPAAPEFSAAAIGRDVEA